ncbi:MAG: NADH:ubiquinone reductase (Na(+)-transporting) subunit F [Tidjanibacter sp.]|nr:NADH:ubiquinone reductase (Na(+)-transporting) subunit F [Tidjanibacter sp.]
MNTTIIIISIVAFLVVLLLLVILLLVAKARLTSSGTVTIDINDGDKKLSVESGSSLLSTLASKKIYLPSACGGQGSCGMCKVQVTDGGGAILPTEVGFFTRRQQKESWRLGCQVKVKQDLKIKIPETILGVKKMECTVVSCRSVSTFMKEFVVSLPAGEKLNFHSGGYIQIDVPVYDEIRYSDMDIDEKFRADWQRFGMFDLVAKNPEPTFCAYSMANQPEENTIIMLDVRIATPPLNRQTHKFETVPTGICSSYIFSRKPGDKVTISGPYGEFFVKDTPNEKMFIGGGAGMAPMRSHIFHLFKTLKTDLPVSFWYGARSKQEIFYQDQFEAIAAEFPNFNFKIGLSDPRPEDNWDPNYIGFIHNVIYNNYLKNHPAPEDIEYYLCGPPMMISATVSMLDNLGVPPENILYDNFGG